MAINTLDSKWIQFDADAGEVKSLLYSEFYVWEHSDGSEDISTEEYHIPATIREHIDYVTPGTRLRSRGTVGPKEEKAKRSDVKPAITALPGFPNPNSTSCDKFITAECTRGEAFSFELETSSTKS
jgi:tripeptidyl-peptidase I